jgi:hypothetical protein
MHVRIQGWIPYDCQISINGREWLARRLDEAGIGYVRYDNAVVKIDNLEAAGARCERFAHRVWPRVLNAFAPMVNPIMPIVHAAHYGGYYWVLHQAEIATDVMFPTRAQLLNIWPDLVGHAALNMSSEDVLGFLGRKLHPALAAEVVTDSKRRPHRWRVRHRMGPHGVKMYDKASVLPVETVINNPRQFKILPFVTDADGSPSRRWCPMGKGVSDLWRCYQVGMNANQRYLRAMAAAPWKGEGVAARDASCRSHTTPGRRVARFSPLNPTDWALFKAAIAGQHNIIGFRNADLTARLYRRPPVDGDDAHRRCQRVSRLIVKLRGHGLIAKVPPARLYRVTPYGQRVMTAAVAIHDDQYPSHYLTPAAQNHDPVSRDTQILPRSV